MMQLGKVEQIVVTVRRVKRNGPDCWVAEAPMFGMKCVTHGMTGNAAEALRQLADVIESIAMDQLLDGTPPLSTFNYPLTQNPE